MNAHNALMNEENRQNILESADENVQLNADWWSIDRSWLYWGVTTEEHE